MRYPLIALAFILSFASVLVERGIFFLARDVLAFSDAANLWLALLFGAAYVAGAMGCQALARRFGEKTVLMSSLLAYLAVLGLLSYLCTRGTVFGGLILMGALGGVKWPIIESYMSAGLTPGAAFRAVGRFNITWGSAVPVAMIAEGWILRVYPPATFMAAGALCAVVIAIVAAALPARPAHLAADHPERPDAVQLARQGALLALARWLMLMSYICLLVLVPLAPGIFARLGVETGKAAALSGIVDWARLAAFVALYLSAWWYGRLSPLVVSMAAIPAGSLMVLLGTDLSTVLCGFAIAGLGVGMTYFAALYYAMVVKNASVEAGGGHEGFIGMGLAIGPLAGLLSETLARAVSSKAAGTILGIGPFILFCMVMGIAGFAKRRPRR